MALPDQLSARRLDPAAVRAAVRRLALAAEPPWLHGEVARRMAERLAIVRLQPTRVLDWSSFLGAGAALLARTYPKAERNAVEPSPALQARSRELAPPRWWSALRGSSGASQVLDAEADIPPGAQLVWANMVLHAVADPPRLFRRWQQLLAVDGFVMFSCLGPGTLRELRALYERLGWGAATPGFIDMHDLGDMLIEAGFADPVMDQETLTLHWDSAETLLAELRSLGGNAAPERFAGLRTPRWRRRLLAELESLRDSSGRLGLSFEVAYGHAFKAAPRLRPGEATHVSLDDMRAMVRSNKGSRRTVG